MSTKDNYVYAFHDTGEKSVTNIPLLLATFNFVSCDKVTIGDVARKRQQDGDGKALPDREVVMSGGGRTGGINFFIGPL